MVNGFRNLQEHFILLSSEHGKTAAEKKAERKNTRRQKLFAMSEQLLLCNMEVRA